MKPIPTFTMEELIDEISKGLPCFDSEGATSQEIADALDISRDTVTRKLKAMKVAGLISVVRKYAVSLDGRNISVPAYKLKEVSDNELENELVVSVGGGDGVRGSDGDSIPSHDLRLADRAAGR